MGLQDIPRRPLMWVQGHPEEEGSQGGRWEEAALKYLKITLN